MTKLPFKILLALALLAIVNLAHAATLTSSVNRNPIKLNQTLTLTVQYNDQASSTDLNLTDLAKDFEILATIPSNNSSVSIVNGQTTRTTTTTWTITLAARQEGSLLIPALSVNGAISSPIIVKVNSPSAQELAEPQPVQVNVTIDDASNLSIKPGEQVIINVELSAAANVTNIRGEELQLINADIESLGQQNGQRLENGVPRQVAIWRYAIFPTQAGQLPIPIQTFTGTVGGRSSFFDSFNRGGQQVGGRSVEQSINVSERTDNNGNTWFPANDVSIKSSWAGDTSKLRVGEPITRTITVTATGQRANVIPPLPSNSQNDYKSYKDQPQLENSNSQLGVIGVRVESEAIVPSASGTLTLPELRVSWWDSIADVWREAVLPAETFNVLPATNAASANIANNITPAVDMFKNQSPQIQTVQNDSNWLWKIATIGLGLLCLVQFYLLSRRKNPSVPKTQKQDSRSLSEANAWRQLQDSLKTEDAKTIRNAILDWSRTALPDQSVANLQSLSAISTSNTLKQQLSDLDKQLYSDGAALDKDKLKTALEELKQHIMDNNKKRHSKKDSLAPLYPV